MLPSGLIGVSCSASRYSTPLDDTTPPNTTIDSQPNATTSQTSASFYFSANETATFQCKLDSGAYASCSSPKNYTGLSSGNHTFSVKAIDSASNEDATPATYSWTITATDTTSPIISQVTPIPPSTTDTTPDYTFNTTEAGTITYGGDCSSATTAATVGNNTITFKQLGWG